MTEPSPSRYALAMSCFGYARIPVIESLQMVGAAGFHGVEGTSDTSHLAPRLNPDIPAIRAAAARAGVEFWTIHLPFSGQFRGENTLEGWHDLLPRTLDIAAALGVRIAVLHSGHFARFGADMEGAGAARAADQVSRLADYAEKLGIRIAAENELTGYAPRFAVELARLVELYTDPRVGFCLDTGHSILGGFDPIKEIRAAGKRLIAVHLNSNPGSGPDVHWLPNHGILNWSLVKQTLIETGYAGAWTMELKPDPSIGIVLEGAREVAGLA